MIGLVFYFLGGKTRREPAVEPVTGATTPADHTSEPTMTRAAPFGLRKW